MNNFFFYLCACSPSAEGSVRLYSGDGVLLASEHVKGANYLAFSPDRTTLYASCNDENADGFVTAFRVNADRTLTRLNAALSGGRAACHLTVSPDGKFVFCANYLTGNFAEFRRNEDGSLGERTQLIQHTGHGPDKTRQLGPHTHCTEMTPDGKFLCAVDLGNDAIHIYPFEEGTGLVNNPLRCDFKPGEGPRHILFDRTGVYAYVINELGNNLVVFAYADGVLVRLADYPTTACNTAFHTKAAALKFSPDGSFLYASNRSNSPDNPGGDSIACFRIHRPDELELIGIIDAHGISPRDIAFLPGGNRFAAANEFSGSVELFDFDPATGRLHWCGENAALPGIPRPLCLLS